MRVSSIHGLDDRLSRKLGPQGGGERNGIPLLPVTPNKALVTLEIVNALRDELP